MSDNSGHRERVKERFRTEGLDNFHPVHALELLLFYCLPRKDTKPLARRLIDHFGSLPRVLEATTEELEQVEGVGRQVSTFLTLIAASARYYELSRMDRNEILDNTSKYGRFLSRHFLTERNEAVYMLCLDAKCKVLCCKKICEGSVNSASVSARRVVELALGAQATSVVLAHNHTSGIALPSAEDIVTTRRLAKALGAVEIVLVDHVIVADDDFVSLAQSGYFRPEDCEILV